MPHQEWLITYISNVEHSIRKGRLQNLDPPPTPLKVSGGGGPGPPKSQLSPKRLDFFLNFILEGRSF